MASRLLEILKNDPVAYVDFLNHLSYDELVELDLRDGTCKNLAHVAGKFYVPLMSGTYDDLYRYALGHMVHPDDRQNFAYLMDPEKLVSRLGEAKVPGTISIEVRFKLLSGGWCWTKLTVIYGEKFCLPDGVARFYILDIHNRKSREFGQVAAAAGVDDRDSRTRLLRERPFLYHARRRIEQGVQGWCFLMLDIEHFRLFNDWYGRGLGDMLLAEIGGLFAAREERDGALAGYLGADDFCLLTPYDPADVEAFYEQIHGLITAHGVSLGFLPAIGVRPFDGAPPVLDLLDEAMIALRQVKGNYTQRICVFRPEMRETSEENYKMLLDFQKAIANGEITFYLQPQCRISTHRIVGAECLARWITPDGRMISPGTFIPVLEQYGFISDLDKYIWEQVCAWQRRRIDGGHTPLPVSVNVSQIDILNMNVPEHLAALTQKYDIEPRLLEVEITESAYASNETRVGAAVAQLRKLGFTVLMDDFGSGYSSLNMLRDINVDVIKLDLRFLQLDADDTEKGIRIFESVLNMTRTMAIPIIVEGVEKADQSKFLSDLGCRYIQGFFFYRPMPVEEFERIADSDDQLDQSGIVFKANQEIGIREFLDQNFYSDTMLNNVLGAVAFYCRNGDNVDIIRFNENFYQLVKAPDYEARMTSIQDFIHPDDRTVFYELLDRAEADRLNGASGVVGVYRSDGSLGQFLLRVYFLEDSESGKKYYSSLQDITEVTQLQSQLRLLSRFSTDSIVFLRKRSGKTSFHVAIHGLREVLGLDQQEFEAELNSLAFMRRVSEADRSLMRERSLSTAAAGQNFYFRFRLENARGETVTLLLKTDYVHDEYSDVEYIIILRQDAE